jgi:type IV pilus assembly protein PilA
VARQDQRRDDQGFTLIELMVVVLVIAVLLAIAIPSFIGARDRAVGASARSNLHAALDVATLTIAEIDAIGSEPVADTVARLQSDEPVYTFTAAASTAPTLVSVAVTAHTVYLAVAGTNGKCYVGVTHLRGRATGETSGACLASSFIGSSVLSGFTDPSVTTTTTAPPTTTTAPSTLTTVRLLSSTGTGLGGGVVQIYSPANWTLGWQAFGATGSDGTIAATRTAESVTVRITYAGMYQDQTATVGPGTTVTFTTTLVTVRLLDSTGNGLTGGTFGYYGSSYGSGGTTDSTGTTTKELLPGSYYYFEMTHDDASQRQFYTVVGTSAMTVTFTTTLVTLRLLDSTGNPIAGGSAGYYGLATYHTIGNTNSSGIISKELLPGTFYYFDMTHDDASQRQFYVVVGGSATTVTFTTTLVTLRLLDSTGTPIAGGSAGYYGLATYHTIGNTNSSGTITKELLPGTFYYFDMTHADTSQRQNYIVVGAAATTVTFTTTLVTARLLDSNGNGLAGGTFGYYGNSSFHSVGTTSSSGTLTIELFAGNYYYTRMTYLSATETRWNTVVSGASTNIDFTTVPVTVTSVTAGGAPRVGVPITFAGTTWVTLGTTDGSGVVTGEVLPVLYYGFVSTFSGGYAVTHNVTVSAPSTSVTITG